MEYRANGSGLAGRERPLADRQSQPNACDKLFSVWRASGKRDPLAYLERIRLAMKAGNTGLVTVLAGQMPAEYQTIASAIITLANDPNNVLIFARTTGATDFTRQMAEVALPASPARTRKMRV